MTKLQIITCLGENTVPICTEIARALSETTGLEIFFEPKALPTEAAEPLCRGEIAMGWICGLLYTIKVDKAAVPFELLAAPVFAGEDVPVYHSKLVVAKESPLSSFDDLRGSCLAINETTSYSGFHLLRSTLVQRGLTLDYFGEVFVAGAHSKSMRAVAEGEADVATIDHSVFDYVVEAFPGIAGQIKVIGHLGPAPAPPFVVHQSVPEEAKMRLQQGFLALGTDPAFIQLVQRHRLQGLVSINDGYYDAIRRDYMRSLSLS
ncbi:MAG: PhnD/SsuA/transferrin family substrate-binding protein [Chloroflexota bacterium]